MGLQAHCAQSLGSAPVSESEVGVLGWSVPATSSVFPVPPRLLPMTPSLQTTPPTGPEIEPCSPVCPDYQLDCAFLLDDAWWARASLFWLSCNNLNHKPSWNQMILSSNIFLGTIPPRDGRCSKSLGNNMNNFHPLVMRDSLPNSCPAITSSRAVLNADLNAPFKMNGMVLKTWARRENTFFNSTLNQGLRTHPVCHAATTGWAHLVLWALHPRPRQLRTPPLC